MNRPAHPPLPQHFDAGNTNDVLPSGWTREWNPEHQLWYYIDIHDPAHPVSQWTFPGHSSSAEQTTVDDLARLVSSAHRTVATHQSKLDTQDASQQYWPSGRGRMFGSGGSGSSQGYTAPSTPVTGGQELPQVSRPSWMEATGMGLGGLAVGAFAEHEWEKHKQGESFQSGMQKAHLEDAIKEQGLEAEMQRMRQDNARLQQEHMQDQQQLQQSQQYRQQSMAGYQPQDEQQRQFQGGYPSNYPPQQNYGQAPPPQQQWPGAPSPQWGGPDLSRGDFVDESLEYRR